MGIDEDVLAALYGEEPTAEARMAKRLRSGSGGSVYTPPPSLTPSGIMSTQMTQPNRQLAGVPAVAERPTIQGLYNKLGTLNEEKLDFSGLQKINEANADEGNSNFARALGMQMFGGKTMQGAGKALMSEGLERSRPIRPNAADIGWTNQATGEFQQNPVMERNQKEKVLTGRIDALVKEQEHRANILVAQGKLAEAEAAARNGEQLKLIMAGIASGNQAITAMLTSSKMRELEERHGAGKPLSSKELGSLTDMSKLYETVGMQERKFKDEYSPQGITGKPGVQVENFVESNFPKVSSMIGKPKDQQRVKEQAAWWRDQEYYNTLPERHALFGSALTPGERASWNAATIQPGMRPEAIRETMKTRKEIMESVARRAQESHIANRKNPAAVRAALSAFGPAVIGEEDDELAAAIKAKGG